MDILRMSVCMLMLVSLASAQPDRKNTYYSSWSGAGPLGDADFFPIGVWYQSISIADDYAAAGVNLYINPTAPSSSELTTLQNNGISIICNQTSTTRSHSACVGYIIGDEPDNGDPDCTPTATVSAQYASIKATDPYKLRFCNFGMGVAYTSWGGRGNCTGQTDMYPEYFEELDIIMFDIYPVNCGVTAVNGNIWYVARGIDNLREWSGYEKPCWAWIEATEIGDGTHPVGNKPTPVQVKSEVWQALIHEAAGYGYFCHSFAPTYSSRAWLNDAEMLSAITKINSEVTQLAPALNSPTIPDQTTVTVNWRTPVETMLKNEGGSSYLFCASNRRGAPTNTATIRIDGLPSSVTSAAVIGENRSVTVSNGEFEDTFDEWQVHLYQFDSPVRIRDDLIRRTARLRRGVRVSSPFTEVLTIQKSPELAGEPLRISVYTADGNRLSVITAGADEHTVTWQAPAESCGRYYLRFEQGKVGYAVPVVRTR